MDKSPGPKAWGAYSFLGPMPSGVSWARGPGVSPRVIHKNFLPTQTDWFSRSDEPRVGLRLPQVTLTGCPRLALDLRLVVRRADPLDVLRRVPPAGLEVVLVVQVQPLPDGAPRSCANIVEVGKRPLPQRPVLGSVGVISCPVAPRHADHPLTDTCDLIELYLIFPVRKSRHV